MFDKDKLDSYFEDVKSPKNKVESEVVRHTKIVRLYKLLLPAIATGIIGLILIIPGLRDITSEFTFDITKPKSGEMEKLHVENTVFYITDANNKISNFHTSNIDETAPGSKLVKLTKPKGKLATKNDTTIDINAKVGYYNQTANLLDLEGNIKAFFSEGMTMETEKITYDFNKYMGYGKTPVKGYGVYGDIKAQGLEFFTKDKLIIFKGKSNIKINDRKSKTKKVMLTVDATKQIELHQSENKVVAIGNVITKNDKNTIYADKMTSFFENNEMKKVDFSGNIKVVSQDGVVTADRGEYFVKEEVVKLYDNVTITQGENKLKGEYAETSMKTGISKIIGSEKSGGRISGVFKEQKKEEKNAE